MWIILHVAPLQPHHSHRAVGADFQFRADGFPAGVAEPALLHHAAGGGVVGEVGAPEEGEALYAEAVLHHQPHGFGADAIPPVGTGDPVAHLALVVGDLQIGGGGRQVAHAADGLAGLLPFHRPHRFGVEDGADDFQALFHALVGRPARAGPHIGVGGILVQGFGVALTPRPEQDSGGLHHVCSSFVSLLLSVGFPQTALRLSGVIKSNMSSTYFVLLFATAKIQCSFGLSCRRFDLKKFNQLNKLIISIQNHIL